MWFPLFYIALMVGSGKMVLGCFGIKFAWPPAQAVHLKAQVTSGKTWQRSSTASDMVRASPPRATPTEPCLIYVRAS